MIIVTDYCVEPRCRCLDRSGVIVYRGPADEQPDDEGPPSGYERRVEISEPLVAAGE